MTRRTESFFRSTRPARLAAATLALGLAAGAAQAQEINVYSSRHYDTDLALYQTFTDQTGIAVNLIEGSADELIERIIAEGGNSPADVLITVDAGRLWRADQAELFQPVSSDILESRVPGASAPSGWSLVRPVEAGTGDLLQSRGRAAGRCGQL